MVGLSPGNAACIFLISILCNVSAFIPAYAQDSGGRESRYYYVGTIGDNLSVQMDLVIDSGDVTGSYMYDRVGMHISLMGEIDKGSSTLYLTEQDEKGRKTGAFKGTVRSGGKGFGMYIEGEWSNASGLSTLPFKLTKVADFVSVNVNAANKYEASYLYPSFISDTKANREITERLAKEAASEKKKFTGEAEEFFGSQESAAQWQENYSYSIEYYSPELVSLSGEVFSYTGGAHGNTLYMSSNYWIKDGKALLLGLPDLFMPGSDYIKVLSDYCVRDLKKQQAGWVLNGELKAFKADDLGLFLVSPRGITFAFAPYAVGPYVEGSYFVTVGFSELKGIINPGGPLKQFLK